MATSAKLEAIRTLIGAAPDAVLSSLAMALSGGGPDLQDVEDMVSREQAVRRLRAVVLAPVLPLFSPREDGVRAPRFPRDLVRSLWQQLGREAPAALESAAREVAEWEGGYPPPACLDELCLEAARVCEEGAADAFRGHDSGVGATRLAGAGATLSINRSIASFASPSMLSPEAA